MKVVWDLSGEEQTWVFANNYGQWRQEHIFSKD